MFNKVLVPLDGSDLAEAVLPYVEDIGKRCAAEVVLLQVVTTSRERTAAISPPPEKVAMGPLADSTDRMTAVIHPVYREQEMASIRTEVRRTLAGVKNRLIKAGLEVRVEVLFGRPEVRIVEYAEKEGVDLLAMATHGRTGVGRWVFGSVAEKVLRASGLPILLIRPPGAEKHRRPSRADLKRLASQKD